MSVQVCCLVLWDRERFIINNQRHQRPNCMSISVQACFVVLWNLVFKHVVWYFEIGKDLLLIMKDNIVWHLVFKHVVWYFKTGKD